MFQLVTYIKATMTFELYAKRKLSKIRAIKPSIFLLMLMVDDVKLVKL
jgi:hypothetical protein